MNIKYEKGIYEAKVGELQGYHSLLDAQLGKLESLKARIPNFWDDKLGRKTVEILNAQIRDVRNVMTQTSIEIVTLQGIVDRLGAVETKQDSELDTTFRALDAASKFMPE